MNLISWRSYVIDSGCNWSEVSLKLLFSQVCLEGQISRKSAEKSLRDGHSPHGDQIPWKFCEQFRDVVFPKLSGARIVRIAVHPNAMKVNFLGLLSFFYLLGSMID